MRVSGFIAAWPVASIASSNIFVTLQYMEKTVDYCSAIVSRTKFFKIRFVISAANQKDTLKGRIVCGSSLVRYISL